MRLKFVVPAVFLVTLVHCSDDKSSDLDSMNFTSDHNKVGFTMVGQCAGEDQAVHLIECKQSMENGVAIKPTGNLEQSHRLYSEGKLKWLDPDCKTLGRATCQEVSDRIVDLDKRSQATTYGWGGFGSLTGCSVGLAAAIVGGVPGIAAGAIACVFGGSLLGAVSAERTHDGEEANRLLRESATEITSAQASDETQSRQPIVLSHKDYKAELESACYLVTGKYEMCSSSR